MRVRLALLEPFPSSKLLLPIPESIKTVHELKKHIIKSLLSVAALAAKSRDLSLEIDGFELLGGSGLDILQDGDVVSVKLAASSSKSTPAAPTKKRKARLSEPQAALPRDAKKMRLVNGGGSRAVSAPVPAKLSSPSLSETSTSASSSSASSSSASTTSSYASSSVSSSDSDFGLEVATSKRPNGDHLAPKEAFPVLLSPKPLGQAQSAPGRGLARTKNRNARKRKALAMRKLEPEQIPSSQAPPASTAASPFAPPATSIQPHPSVDDPTMPFAQYTAPRDMANRNKKKGFLKEMSVKQATRTVFNDEIEVDASLVPSASATTPLSGSMQTPRPSKWKHIPVVAPSDNENLPSNVFVTSKEYDLRRPKARGPTTKETNGAEDGEEAEADDQGLVNGHSPVNHLGGRDESDLWEEADRTFDALPNLISLDAISSGGIIAWKELELDLITFSPEMMLNLAQVTLHEGLIHVKHLVRPVVVDEEADWNADGEEVVKEKPGFTLSNQDLLKTPGKYRIVRDA